MKRRTQRQKVYINAKRKATQIIGQRKAFCQQIIPRSNYARAETVEETEVLITSGNSDAKSYNL